jgi:hypothetical protein
MTPKQCAAITKAGARCRRNAQPGEDKCPTHSTSPSIRRREPFQPGHELSLVHGGRSERKIAPRAQAHLDALLADPSLPAYLRDDLSYRGALAGLARAEAVCDLLEIYLQDRRVTRGVLPVLDLYRRWLTSAASHRRALGLDPMGRAALMKDVKIAQHYADAGLEELARQGAEIRARRAEREQSEGSDDA